MTFKKLYIDAQVVHMPLAVSIRKRIDAPVQIISDKNAVFEIIRSEPDPIEFGKSTLFLTRNKGAFIRSCPGTRHYTCCGYKILHIGTFCTLDCSYCILQTYFHPPILQFYVNHQDLDAALDDLFAGEGICRIGTGEFTDSLIWESVTNLSEYLVLKFSAQSRAVLELKTKTATVDSLEGLPHNRKTIVAWSLNTPRVIRSEERGTASLSDRFEAASKCEHWGYPLAFHFDPMVLYDGCMEEYPAVIDQLYSRISAGNVVWISMGTFRFMPPLKTVIRKRFPDSRIVYGEFVPGLDGKMRYFKPLRTALYRAVADRIRSYDPEVAVYLCMEDETVWERALGVDPSKRGGLPAMLDRTAKTHCGLE